MNIRNNIIGRKSFFASLSLSVISLLFFVIAQSAFAANSSSLTDLTGTDIGVNDDGYVYFTVSNIGTTDLSSNRMWITKLYIDGKLKRAYPWRTYSKGALAAGQSATITTKYILPGGEHDVRIYVDANNRVYESNENNNSLEKTLNGIDENYSDLVIGNISADSAGKLSVEMKNTGTENITLSSDGKTVVYVNGAKYSFNWSNLASDDFLNAGGSTNIEITTLAAGTYDVYACVDTSNVVYETDESNNCANKEDIVIAELPETKADLTIGNVSANSDGLLSVEMKNIGTDDASSDANGMTDIYINGEKKYTYSWSSLSDKSFLKAGGSTTINPATLSAGSYSIYSCIDSSNVVSESKEDNNCSTAVSITVDDQSDMADMIVQSIGLNKYGYIYFKMANIGTKDAVADDGKTTVYVDDVKVANYYWENLSDNSFLEADTSGNSYTKVTTDTKLASGSHNVKVFIDSGDVVDESNEANNTSTVSLTGL